jgi:hypothetical protein
MPYRNLLLRNSSSIQNVVSVWKVIITLVTYLLDNCSYYKSVTLVIHQGSLLHWMMGRDLNMILIYIYPLNHMSVNMSPMITIVPNFHQLLKRSNTFYINCQRKVHIVFFFFFHYRSDTSHVFGPHLPSIRVLAYTENLHTWMHF